ncbi:MAG: NTP transferase domain-containing protein [Nitrososphaeria archaeon]|nr:NTP transferase domain-containing protein [Nitrososphaeria archaeon]NIQ33263.1 NTP transferase domain-containing protein [Nitrososphaeria archaeon]
MNIAVCSGIYPSAEDLRERSAIVLAGGTSLRFSRFSGYTKDKALESHLGKTFLEHVVEKVSNVVEEVVITVHNEERKERCIRDRPAM